MGPGLWQRVALIHFHLSGQDIGSVASLQSTRGRGGREGGGEGGREGGREGGMGGREEGREGGREGGRERGREEGREGGREEGREGGMEQIEGESTCGRFKLKWNIIS